MGTDTARGFYEDPDKGTVIGRAVRAVVRWFWGQSANPAQAPSRVHVPLASAIAEASSQLLFEEMPTITVEGSQERLDEIIRESGLHAKLQEAAEVCAAYGGVYLRASWDTTLADVPLTDVIPPDCAAPEWSHGHLVAVTFWRTVREDAGTVWRHLERHEHGQVLHGLYRGTRGRLGQQVDLTEQPETAAFAEAETGGVIRTGLDGLAVVYIPNVRPNRMLRGSPLGRSDFSGIEQVLDLLDEAWSSWARELRLSKARAVVPNTALEDMGPGNGAHFDEDREIWSGLEMLPGQDANPSQLVQLIQPAIRVEEHARTCAEVAKQAVRGAGYSAPGIAEEGDGQAVTATEIHDRKGRSLQTRARKIGYWRPELGSYIEGLLGIDVTVWPGAGAVVERPEIEWPDAVTPDPEALSRALSGIATAEAASIRTRVAMLHPDWDEPAIDEEVERIRGDRAGEADPWMGAAEGLAGNRIADGGGPAGEEPAE
nr:phage portal protein [Streptomonospora sp. PA3]